MNDPRTNTRVRTKTRASKITLSADGYVRLTLDVLLATPFFHMISGLYENTSISACEGASFSATHGYTEWVSTTEPVLSIGWDWQLGVSQGLPSLYSRLDFPHSNVMLIDARQCDVGVAQTMALLELFIDSMPWQTEVNKHIVARYA